MENSDLSSSNPSYHAYMLRFWSEQQPGETAWRFTLLDPNTGQRKGFQSLDALVNHLVTLTSVDQTSTHAIPLKADDEQQA